MYSSDLCSFANVFFVPFWFSTETNIMPYHPCLFFVKVEVGRKKKAEDDFRCEVVLFDADGVDAC